MITYISPNLGLTDVVAYYTATLFVPLSETTPGRYEGDLPPDTPNGRYVLTVKEGAETTGYGEYIRGADTEIISPSPSAAYASFQDFILRFGERETLDVSVAKVAKPLEYNQPRCEAALLDATGLIDSYLASRYDTAPLHASPSGELKRHTVNVARFYLAQHRDPELYRYLYEEAIKWCEAALEDGRSLITGAGVRVPQYGAGDGTGEPGAVQVSASAYSHNAPLRSFSQQGFRNTGGVGYRRRF